MSPDDMRPAVTLHLPLDLGLTNAVMKALTDAYPALATETMETVMRTGGDEITLCIPKDERA